VPVGKGSTPMRVPLGPNGKHLPAATGPFPPRVSLGTGRHYRVYGDAFLGQLLQKIAADQRAERGRLPSSYCLGRLQREARRLGGERSQAGEDLPDIAGQRSDA